MAQVAWSWTHNPAVAARGCPMTASTAPSSEASTSSAAPRRAASPAALTKRRERRGARSPAFAASIGTIRVGSVGRVPENAASVSCREDLERTAALEPDDSVPGHGLGVGLGAGAGRGAGPGEAAPGDAGVGLAVEPFEILDDPVRQVEVAPREGHGGAVDDEVVAVRPGDALDGAEDALEDRIGELLLLLLELLVVLDEGLLKLDHLLLPVVDLLLQRRLRQHRFLLVDLFLLLLKVGLALVQLLLAAVEHLLERGLRPQAVLGLHDGALDVDDGHLHLRGSGRAEERHERG